MQALSRREGDDGWLKHVMRLHFGEEAWFAETKKCLGRACSSHMTEGNDYDV
jgi:hypothetical protein